MSERDDVSLDVTLDKWGFRYRGTPGNLGEGLPASWRQVWRQVNRHLMRLVSGTTACAYTAKRSWSFSVLPKAKKS